MVPKSWQRTKQEQSKGSSQSSVTFTPIQGWSQTKLSQIGAGSTTAEMQGKNWVSATKRYPRLDLDIVERCTILLHVLQLKQDHHWLYDHGTPWHRCWPGAPIASLVKWLPTASPWIYFYFSENWWDAFRLNQYEKGLLESTVQQINKSGELALTERLVSLYLVLMSAAVSCIASIASSRVTLWIPRLAIASWAAVTAFTAVSTNDNTNPRWSSRDRRVK